MAISKFEKFRKKLKSYVISKYPGLYWSYRMYRRGWAEPELRILKAFVEPNTDVIDVGGNLGLFVYYLAPISNHVHTFEASPKMARILKSGYGKKNNVTVYETALSDSNGDAELRIPNFEGHSGYATIEPNNSFDGKIDISDGVSILTVQKRTLDSFCVENISFIKIDVEGHEEEVLMGAYQLLKKNKPVVLAEVEERHRPNSVGNINKYMVDLGYKTFFLRNNMLESINNFSVESDQDKSLPELYVRNFIYIPIELIDKIKKRLSTFGVKSNF